MESRYMEFFAAYKESVAAAMRWMRGATKEDILVLLANIEADIQDDVRKPLGLIAMSGFCDCAMRLEALRAEGSIAGQT